MDADLSALLLVDGRVRDDTDFIFYNQAATADERVRHDGKRAQTDDRVADRVVVELIGLDDQVNSIAFAASLDAPQGRSFADFGPLRATVTSHDGAVVADYELDALGAETAVVALELYRRAGAWKVRAVGQGYHDGLAGLARDFGVSITADSADGADPAAAAPGGAPPLPAVDWRNPPVPAGYEL
jgi:stress response protein SCP2